MPASSRRLLVLNFFPAFYPPNSGGEQRLFHLYQHLSQQFDVTLLSSTYPGTRREVVPFSSTFRDHRIPKEVAHIRCHTRLIEQGIGAECSGYVCALAAEEESGFRDAFEDLQRKTDIIVHQFPFTLPYDREFGRDGRPRVYNSENVESVLAAQMFRGPFKDVHVTAVTDLERRLVRGSDLVAACSEEDRLTHIALYGCDPDRTMVVPNGFEPSDEQPDEPPPADLKQPFAFFLGSSHPPNVEAATFISDVLASETPDITYVIAGSVCRNPEVRPRPNVFLLGTVSDPVRLWLLRNCAVALNPVILGSGTNLKILDYLAAGALVLTTPFGARGLELTPRSHCLIAARDSFASEIGSVFRGDLAADAIRRNGKALIGDYYSWRRIAGRFAERIQKLSVQDHSRPAPARRKPRLLALNDYPIASPTSGGEFRLSHLSRRLGKIFDITFLCLTAATERADLQLAEGVRQISIPKTRAHLAAERATNAGNRTSANDVLAAVYCEENQDLLRNFRNLEQTADLVVCEHPYMSPLLCHRRQTTPVIYAAQNVESDLKRALLAGHTFSAPLSEVVRQLEDFICGSADVIIAVSREDQNVFRARYPSTKVEVVRNGVEIPEQSGSHEIRTTAPFHTAFIGSSHPPNIEAVQFILTELAPALPDIRFHIVGIVCSAIPAASLPDNVVLEGYLSDEAKLALLAKTDLGLNPMFSGGGSNLKIAEFLASGVPVVSTSFGIRGYDLVPGKDIFIADAAGFAGRIRNVLADPEARLRASQAGREYAVAELGWDGLADRYARIAGRLIRPSAQTNRKRLLVVTYRFNQPPRGGAEVYLAHALRAISDIGDFDIDIAAPDVLDIQNRYHFSAEYQRVADGKPVSVDFARNIFLFGTEPPAVADVYEVAASLFDCWLSESVSQARSFLPRYRHTTLMGGWHALENMGGGPARWTGAHAELYRNAEVNKIIIHAYADRRTSVQVLDGTSRELFNRDVEGGFTITLADLPRTPDVLSILTSVQCLSADDPRPLGILVRRIEIPANGSSRDVPLSDDFERLLRTEDPEAWVSSLIEVTNRRPLATDRRFVQIRGPRSPELERFVIQNCRDYDCVLVQGVPFSTSVITAALVKESGKPMVVLPHAHIDDRYYHWRSFYDTFRASDLTIASGKASQRLFFDRIGAKSISLPGGGVDPSEFRELGPSIAAWESVWGCDEPFVLVLGRKSGAKRYRDVIEAVREVRKAGKPLHVVLIGPDEDGVPLNDSFVHYFGRQPRSVVLGALSRCTALANMSESESFGIVVVEAWMCSRPVLANSNCIAFSELIDHSIDGLLCNSSEELASGILSLLRSPDRAREMGLNGWRKAQKHFVWREIGAAFNRHLLHLATTFKAASLAAD